MKQYLKNKYLGLLLLVVLLVGSAFVVQAQTAEDHFDFGYFQCDRHGQNEYQNCNGVFDYYGARNDYVGGSVSYNFEGHRHGASGINAQVCLVAVYPNIGSCETFSCAGDTCGYEYGGQHPWNGYASGDMSFSSSPSPYRVYREANVTDAQIRVHANGYAVYETPIYGCTDPTASNYNNSATVDDGSCTYTFTIVNLNFIVRNQSGVAISGASVNINQNFGNGTNRVTDGSGFANFGVNANTNIGYSVLATGCSTVNGSVNSGSGTTVEVTMNCTGPVAGNPPTCSPSDQNTFVGQTVNFTADSNGGGAVTWSAPGGSPTTGAGLSFSASYATAGVKTVTASNTNGSTYYSSCTVDVQDPPPPPPMQVTVERPACSNVPYNAMIRWPGFGPGVFPDTGASGYYVDVTTDPTFDTMWNRRVFAPADSTIALDGFSCLLSNFCNGTPTGETMILQPNKTYYARIWNGSHQPSPSGISFNVPSCDPAPVLDPLTHTSACFVPGEPYGLNLSWTGAPYPGVGYYVDVTTDPSFGSFWNRKVPAINNSTTGLSGFSCSDTNWCFSAPPGPIELQAGTTYYARVYGGGGHSNTREFTMPECRLLQVSSSGTGSGTITGPVGVTVSTGWPLPVYTFADGINCGLGFGNCSEWYVDGTTVNSVDANPASGSQFGNWASGGSMICPGSTASSCVFTISGNRQATANFNLLAGFDYNLTTPPMAVVVKGTGNTGGSHVVTRNLTSGTPQPVILSISGAVLGAGVVEYSISNNHSSCVSAGCTGFSSPSTITFTVYPTAPAGNHTITVRGTSAGIPDRTTTFTLNIQEPTIAASCSSNPTPATQASLGQQVTWTASATGANPPFTYTWSGTGIPTNPQPSSNPYTIAYSTIGNKTASVIIVDSVGYSIGPISCNNGVPLRVRFSPIFNEF